MPHAEKLIEMVLLGYGRCCIPFYLFKFIYFIAIDISEKFAIHMHIPARFLNPRNKDKI